MKWLPGMPRREESTDLLQSAQSVFIDPVLNDLALNDPINRVFRPRRLPGSGRDIPKRAVPILPPVRPTRRPTSHHQIPFGDLELNRKMVVGEGGAHVGNEVFDRFQTTLSLRRPRIVVVQHNDGPVTIWLDSEEW